MKKKIDSLIKKANKAALPKKRKKKYSSEETKDILFDVLMNRLTVLEKNKPLVKETVSAALKDADTAKHLIKQVYAAMGDTISLIESKKEQKLIKTVGLLGVYAWAFHTWINEDSKHMAKTMARLDKGLGVFLRAF
ncbi:MAG: hypothetical protein FWF23_00475 [Alphaproteobacteria bacterium]|nr:hypothetical protein [Alphaproteobacteria bacterium]MCL2504889.1 hypothetical protein [Alphaproteobacteria bacterium]